LPGAPASKVLVLPALGDDAKSQCDALEAALTETLGDERWKFFKDEWNQRGTPSLRNLLGLDANELDQEMGAWISEKNGKFFAQSAWAAKWASRSSAGIPLEDFLPGASSTLVFPDGRTIVMPAEERMGLSDVPQPLRQTLLDWFRQQAASRLGGKGTP
jgi:hypothetical protein